jgi:hypothetical protein
VFDLGATDRKDASIKGGSCMVKGGAYLRWEL